MPQIPTRTPNAAPHPVRFVGAGPGDPELLTLKALRAFEGADVVIHDRLVSGEILALAARGTVLIDVGKRGFGPATTQSAINELIVRHAGAGARVVRLKSGDPTPFAGLDEEIDACDAAGLAWDIVPGLTAASAAVAAIGQSLTRRGRNSAIRLLTGHDVSGFAAHDWAALARPGEVAAIYMGKKPARFLQGRLLMHGGNPATPLSIVENASRCDQRVVATPLARLRGDLRDAGLNGPVLILLGLAPHAARSLIQHQQEHA